MSNHQKHKRAIHIRRKTDRLVFSIAELRDVLGIGRAAAYALARRLGRRLGGKRGRLLVPRRAVERWLEGAAS